MCIISFRYVFKSGFLFLFMEIKGRDSKKIEEIARKNILRKSEEAVGSKIEGYDFNQGVDFDKILDSYKSLGLQGSNFYRAVEIIRNMIDSKSFIYLGCTSNIITSGMRDIIRYLVQNKKINVLVTSAGGIEEDIIKCLGDFTLGDFRASGSELREKGINRAGNIFIPNSRYCSFEDFIMPILEKFYDRQKETGEVLTPSELIWEMGKEIKDEKSIYYWAWKNKLPVFCPAITDGSLGDMIYFFKSKHPDFKVDVAEDIWKMNNTTLDIGKSGIIILGGGFVKHHICNANMFRNGADYSVFINTLPEYDGSDSGALPEEAVSWGKILPNAESVKIYSEASLVFPLIVAETFAKS